MGTSTIGTGAYSHTCAVTGPMQVPSKCVKVRHGSVCDTRRPTHRYMRFRLKHALRGAVCGLQLDRCRRGSAPSLNAQVW